MCEHYLIKNDFGRSLSVFVDSCSAVWTISALAIRVDALVNKTGRSARIPSLFLSLLRD